MTHPSKSRWTLVVLGAVTLGLFGCSSPPPTDPRFVAKEPTQLLWGDTHVHTSNGSDPNTPQASAVDAKTAYRWARGLPVVHPHTQAKVQLQTPLDFAAVTDPANQLAGETWGARIAAAESNYAPCKFTTFIGWEWASEIDGDNLHRVVLMNQGAEQARKLTPFSSAESPEPEALWAWLEETSARVDSDFIAIPHNPNLSRGLMYPEVDGAGKPIGADYARTRMRWEPVAEVAQIRGDSETHPALSPEDPFADFEIFPHTPDPASAKVSRGAYARSALLRGLAIEQTTGVNPFQFGLIGSTDSDTGLASADEAFFWSATPAEADSEFDPRGLSAQGLTAVWAEENTRGSIFRAFRRKEVYATTGPRIRVRFFGGWHFAQKQAALPNMVTLGYTEGLPMGSSLDKGPDGKAPSFLMYAIKDPDGAHLDRIQMVKGWVDAAGHTHEDVYDVVWSGDRGREPNGELTPVANTVDIATATDDGAEGADALYGFWSDPHFDPTELAFYYLRVLQVPTPRHTLYDAVARGLDPNDTGHPTAIQERAYTSPIWYTP